MVESTKGSKHVALTYNYCNLWYQNKDKKGAFVGLVLYVENSSLSQCEGLGGVKVQPHPFLN
jgi:hypothetical protein